MRVGLLFLLLHSVRQDRATIVVFVFAALCCSCSSTRLECDMVLISYGCFFGFASL